MRFLQLIDPALHILVESSDMKAVDGAVVDLKADGKCEPAALLLVFAPAHAGDAVVRVDAALVGERQHRQPRQARKIDEIVARLHVGVKQRLLRRVQRVCAPGKIGNRIACRKRKDTERLLAGA